MAPERIGGVKMRECHNCVFHNLNCSGEEAVFILEVLIRIRPEIGSYCALFDSVSIETYRHLQEYLSTKALGYKDCEEISE